MVFADKAFSRHADRTTITPSDVLLLARKNEDLAGLLEKEVAESVQASKPHKKNTGQKSAGQSRGGNRMRGRGG